MWSSRVRSQGKPECPQERIAVQAGCSRTSYRGEAEWPVRKIAALAGWFRIRCHEKVECSLKENCRNFFII
jgi:hypothetical protein